MLTCPKASQSPHRTRTVVENRQAKIAGYAILRHACGYDPSRLKRLDARFGVPMYPGETLRTEIWRQEHGRLAFRCRVLERDAVVLSHGYAEIVD